MYELICSNEWASYSFFTAIIVIQWLHGNPRQIIWWKKLINIIAMLPYFTYQKFAIEFTKMKRKPSCFYVIAVLLIIIPKPKGKQTKPTEN